VLSSCLARSLSMGNLLDSLHAISAFCPRMHPSARRLENRRPPRGAGPEAKGPLGGPERRSRKKILPWGTAHCGDRIAQTSRTDVESEPEQAYWLVPTCQPPSAAVPSGCGVLPLHVRPMLVFTTQRGGFADVQSQEGRTSCSIARHHLAR